MSNLGKKLVKARNEIRKLRKERESITDPYELHMLDRQIHNLMWKHLPVHYNPKFLKGD